MRCERCDDKAVFSQPALCKNHFVDYFEEKVAKTIKEHDLIPPGANVCVAASGGKDSLTTLFILKKFGYAVTALVIDEGIANYREHTLADLKAFCTQHAIPLKQASFKEFAGKSLDETLTNKTLHPCTVCGTFRRYLINKHAARFDILATGHNADDEAQATFMNLCRAHTGFLGRPGPKTQSRTAPSPPEGFVQRVKPLYFCTEKEVMAYSLLQGLTARFTECPYAPAAYRSLVRDKLNAYEAVHPGTKMRIVKQFLKLRPFLFRTDSSPGACAACGEPATADECAACRLKRAITPQ